MSEAITGELDLGRIADYLTASVAATMRLEKASIWLRDRDGWLERRGRRDDRLSPTAALRRVLRQEGKPVATSSEISLHFADDESEEFRERLLEEGFRLLVPLVYRERLMGILALKEKLSGERFDRDDQSLLSTLANQSALAIETALLHDEMTRQAELKRDLEIARDIQTSLLPRNVPEIAGLLLLRRQHPGARGRRRLLRLHPVRGRAARGRHRRRLRQVGAGLAPDGRGQGDRLLAGADDDATRARSSRSPTAASTRSSGGCSSRSASSCSTRTSMTLRYAIGGQPLPILLRSGDGGPRLLDPPEHRLPLGRLPGRGLRHARALPAAGATCSSSTRTASRRPWTRR